MVPLTIFSGSVDREFNNLFEFEFLEGTDFSALPISQLDSVVIINETAKKKLGLIPAIGAKMPSGKTVVGVVKDFHFGFAKYVIEPVELYYKPRDFRNIQFSYRAGDKEAVIAHVTLALSKLGVTGTPSIQEIKGYFESSYKKEAQLVTIFDVLTTMVVLVSFLGLFALSSFENKLREKEIGRYWVLAYLHLIRKRLNKRFTWLIALSIMISIPLTYYGIQKWIIDFPYRLENLSPFFSQAIIMVGVLAMTVLGLHSYFSAQKNPVDVLKNE